jgi:23S rRNA (uracil1939-C5)-methyltransferase
MEREGHMKDRGKSGSKGKFGKQRGAEVQAGTKRQEVRAAEAGVQTGPKGHELRGSKAGLSGLQGVGKGTGSAKKQELRGAGAGSSRPEQQEPRRQQAGERNTGRASAKRAGSKSAARLWEANLPVRKNEEYEAEIVGINHDGEGVGRVDGFTLFVGGALPGERVLVKVVHLKKQYGYGKLLRVLRTSQERVKPECDIYEQCGGCQLQHLSYEAQLQVKRQQVVDNLERIGKLRVVGGAGWKQWQGEGQQQEGRSQEQGTGKEQVQEQGTGELELRQGKDHELERELHQSQEFGKGPSEGEFIQTGNQAAETNGIIVHPTLGMSDPWRYRNKAQVPFGEEEGGLIGGFYAQGSHRIIDMEKCLIQHEANDDVVARVKAIGQRLGISAYHEETHQGLLRHVVVKVGFRTGEIMIVLITNGERIPSELDWIKGIREAIPGVQSICQNVNTNRTNVIFGDKTRVLWGHDVIYDYIGEVKFAISARSFFQVNPVQTEVLYGKALEYAALSGDEVVIDAYCGIGTISLFLAQRAGQVYGVEIVEEAIADARKNAELNGMTNVQFEAGPAEVVLPAWTRQGVKPDVIVVDPPRKGCEPSLLETILELQPRRVVYVSCNASTLARDLRVLVDGGYRVAEVQPVDMFPHTVHVESVILMVQK